MKRKHRVLIDTAGRMAARIGLVNISQYDLCREAGVPEGSFKHVTGKSFGEFITELYKSGVPVEARDVTKTRVNPELRRALILSLALEHAERVGWNTITRGGVAIAANVSAGTVTHYFGTIDGLRDAVLCEAITRGRPRVVAQALSVSHPRALRAPRELIERAAAIISTGEARV